jgi:streptogramin lyase
LPAAIAVEATGALVVVDAGLRAVVRVDPHTGDRKIVSCRAIDAQRNCLGTPMGQGPPLLIPLAIAIGAGGEIWVADAQRHAVLRVDPHTGERKTVSGCLEVDEIDPRGECVGGSIGHDPPIDFPRAMSVEATGTLMVVDGEIDAVVRVDPSTGEREIVSDASIGRGLPLPFPVAIAVEASGSLVVIDEKIDAVVRVDADTGNRVIVSIGAE